MDYNVKLKINGAKLCPSNRIKYLGIWIDNDLSWRSHISDNCSQAQNGKWSFSQTKTLCFKQKFSLLFTMLFFNLIFNIVAKYGDNQQTP